MKGMEIQPEPMLAFLAQAGKLSTKMRSRPSSIKVEKTKVYQMPHEHFEFDFVLIHSGKQEINLSMPWSNMNLIIPGTNTIHIQKAVQKAKQMAIKEGKTTIMIVPQYKEASWMQDLSEQCELHALQKDQLTDGKENEYIVVMVRPQQAATYAFLDTDNRQINRLADDTDLEEIHDQECQKNIMREHHTLGHFGGVALAKAIIMSGKRWPSLSRDCSRYVRECRDCQKYTIYKKGYHPYSPVVATLPMDHVSVDLFQLDTSSEGYNFVLLLIDICTRFVFLRPLKTKDAASVARKIFKIFCGAGFPRILQSDNGTEFINRIIDQLKEKCAIEHRTITPYHPRGNGAAERYVRTAKEALFKDLQGASTEWVLKIPTIQYAMNVKASALHGSSPFTLFFGRKFNHLGDFRNAISDLATAKELDQRFEFLSELVFPTIAQKVLDVQRIRSSKFDSHCLLTDLPAGAMVMTLTDVKSGKSAARYEGPFKVLRRTRGGAYELLDNDGKPLPRKYAPSQVKLIAPADFNGAESSYEVQEILNHRQEDGKKSYLVRWRGYTEEEDSWVDER